MDPGWDEAQYGASFCIKHRKNIDSHMENSRTLTLTCITHDASWIHPGIQGYPGSPGRNHKNIQGTLAQPGLTLCHAATVHRKALQISLPRWMDVHDAWSLPLNRTKIRWTAKLIWYCSLWYYKSLGVVFEQIRFTRQSSWWFKWPSKCPEIHKSWKHGVSIVSHAAFLRKRRGIDP